MLSSAQTFPSSQGLFYNPSRVTSPKRQLVKQYSTPNPDAFWLTHRGKPVSLTTRFMQTFCSGGRRSGARAKPLPTILTPRATGRQSLAGCSTSDPAPANMTGKYSRRWPRSLVPPPRSRLTGSSALQPGTVLAAVAIWGVNQRSKTSPLCVQLLSK